MTLRDVLKELDDAAVFIASVDQGRITCTLSADSTQKLEWLKRSDRDFFAITPKLNGAVRKAFADARKQRLSPDQTRRSVAAAAKAVIVERFRTNGGDVVMKPLSRAWVIAKTAAGAPRLIGLYTQQLFEEIRARAFGFRRA